MAADPSFSSTVNVSSALVGAAETNLQVPTQAVTVFTAGTSGSKVEEIVIHAASTALTPTTVAGNMYLFLHDGTTAHLFDVIPITAVTASATVAPFRSSRTYTNLLLRPNWTLQASQSVAANANLLKVTAFGGDY